MRIRVQELSEVMRILSDHLERTRAAEIEVEEDYYWHIPDTERYDPYKKPSELTIGQLPDDWAELRKLLAQDALVPANLHLVWLASILRRLGER